MGSLNNGLTPSQNRESTRQTGRGFTTSADRVETRTKVDGSGIIGPQINVSAAQLAAQKLSDGVKITRATDDTTVSFVAVSGLIDL